MNEDYKRVKRLRDLLVNDLKEIEHVYFNSDLENGYPGILNFSVKYIEGESLIAKSNRFAFSSGSACTSSSLEPSYVIRAIH